MDRKPMMPVAISLSEILAQRSRSNENTNAAPDLPGEAESQALRSEAKPDSALQNSGLQDSGLQDFWKSKTVNVPRGKSSIHLRVDSDVLEWFKGQGKGHLTRMNAVLRAYMEAKRG